MTIEEMQDAKRKAEYAIRDALNAFMDATGLSVTEVRVTTGQVMSRDRGVFYVAGEIRLDVRL